jgi:hypothetical protein
MTQPQLAAAGLHLIQARENRQARLAGVPEFKAVLGIDATDGASWIEKLPFAAGDTTAGTETELQTAVIGSRYAVDLPRTIERSNFFKNLVKRTASGDMPRTIVNALPRPRSAYRSGRVPGRAGSIDQRPQAV